MADFDPEWIAKYEALRASGVDPYPSGLEVTHTSSALHAHYAQIDDPTADGWGADVAVGGRVRFRNHMGKAVFLRLQDRGEPVVQKRDAAGEAVVGEDGSPEMLGGLLQVYARREELGEAAFALLKGLDIGDFVWARGHVMRTRTGELTVQAREIRLASKTLKPFPDRWNSVTDVQLRARQRYVDLFMNEGTREVFRKRARIIRAIRRYFEDREFVEVETPMMQVIPGGATARPFVTHHNALDIDLYLRIAPELYLKRLVVGGFERVFEINRNFRNEGIDLSHNPEFTMLEFYMAWATYEHLVDLTEDLIAGLVREVTGGTRVRFGDLEIDYTPPFARRRMEDLVAAATGLSGEALRDPAALRECWLGMHPETKGMLERGEPLPNGPLPTTWGRWWARIFDVDIEPNPANVEPNLVNPTFVTHFPAEISPLARRSDEDPEIVDRFELFIASREIANAFSELNDPVDQAARFEAQAKARAEGDDESMYFDHDYVRALSYGMPPTAGEGIGIDRLVMLLTGCTSIREVILFPTLRPEKID